MTSNESYHIIADDLEAIRRGLHEFADYDFAEEVAGRMRELGLSQNALASRALVSRTMVGKWLNGGAKPHGKERFKELGLALGMDEQQLNTFLRANSYPGLYARNPLDFACRFVLKRYCGSNDVVRNYRDFIAHYHLDAFIVRDKPVDIATTLLMVDFSRVQSTGSMDLWLHNNDCHFQSFRKTYIPHALLIQYLLLFIGEQTINELYVTGELPLALRNLLYPLLADKEVAVRGLRAKLIIYGLYENMTEDEIDAMLDIANLRPVTEASSRIELVILSAIRRAHERYPYFVLANAEKVLENLKLGGTTHLNTLYENKKKHAQELARYYEAEKNEQDRLFEQRYTSYADKNILHYLSDILLCLVAARELTTKETEEYTSLMQTYANPE